MSTTRKGKIARLPRAVREELNRRLADGEPGVRLVAWLNAQPEAQQALKKFFEGRAINETNLSEWKQGGYLEWEARQELAADAQAAGEEAKEIEAATDGALAERLSTIVGARYAQVLAGWRGETDEGWLKKLRGLRALCQDIGTLRRGDLRAARLELATQRYADEKRSRETKALEICLTDGKEWPEVSDTFQRAFELMRLYRANKRVSWKYEQRKRDREQARLAREDTRNRVKWERGQKERGAHREKEKQRWMAMNPGQNPEFTNWEMQLDYADFDEWKVTHPGKTKDDFLRAKHSRKNSQKKP